MDTVRTWRGRFAAGGLPALADRERSGRPASFTALHVAEVKALACQLPAESGVPLSRWSCPELAREVVSRSITGSISASTVRRWLKQDALKPWQYRSWMFVRDPAFRPKTGIRPFMNLVTQVMTTQPYASARRVFWIVDNGSSPPTADLPLFRSTAPSAVQTCENGCHQQAKPH